MIMPIPGSSATNNADSSGANGSLTRDLISRNAQMTRLSHRAANRAPIKAANMVRYEMMVSKGGAITFVPLLTTSGIITHTSRLKRENWPLRFCTKVRAVNLPAPHRLV